MNEDGMAIEIEIEIETARAPQNSHSMIENDDVLDTKGVLA